MQVIRIISFGEEDKIKDVAYWMRHIFTNSKMTPQEKLAFLEEKHKELGVILSAIRKRWA